MAYFPDLSNEYQIAFGDDVRAIGWLDKNHSFTTNSANPDFLQILKRHIAERWTFVASAGIHECELCYRFASACNVVIPTRTFVYIAPEMISHYIEAHNYKPPDEFIQAVIGCPQQKSPEYIELVQKYMYHWEE
jgi:hypothetical protein